MAVVPRQREDAATVNNIVQCSQRTHQRPAIAVPKVESPPRQRNIKYNIRDVGQLFKLLNIKPNPNKIEYYSRIIKSIGIRESPEIVEDFINYFESNKTFWKI